MTTYYTNLSAAKVENWKELVPGGYKLHSGWALQDTASGELVTFDGKTPYMPVGGKKAVQSIVKGGGLTEKPLTVSLSGAQ